MKVCLFVLLHLIGINVFIYGGVYILWKDITTELPYYEM